MPYGVVKRTASIPMSFFNLSQNVLGAGAFAIPAAIAATGRGGGVFLMLFVASMAIFTLLALTYFTNTLNQQTYQGLVRHILGKRAAVVTQVLILFYGYGSGIIYLQLVRDNLQVPFQHWFGYAWYTDRRFLIAIYTMLLPWPLSYLKNMATLSYGSTIGVLFVLYAVFFVAIDGIIFLMHNPAPPLIEGFNPSINFAKGFPNVVFAFMTHVGFVPIAAELRNPTMKRHTAVVIISFALCLAVYFSIGIVGYSRIGSACFTSVTEPACLKQFPYFLKYNATGYKGPLPDLTNILNFYDPSYIPATVGRLGMCITLAMGFPLSTFVGRITIRTLFNHNKEFSRWMYFWVTTVWCATTLAFTIGLDSISVVFSFVGNISGSAFMLVFPAMMLIYTFKGSKFWLVIGTLTILFGVSAGMTAIVAHFL